jgi:hypothetical protein
VISEVRQVVESTGDERYCLIEADLPRSDILVELRQASMSSVHGLCLCAAISGLLGNVLLACI